MSYYIKKERRGLIVNKNYRKIGGISTPQFVISATIILSILHTFIIISILGITRASGELSDINSRYGRYINEAIEMQAGTSVLLETSSSFLLKPAIEKDGSTTVNIGPVMAYAAEYVRDRRGEDVLESFRAANLSDDIVSHIETATGAANNLISMQMRAIKLTEAVYPFPPLPQLNNLPQYTLTEEESAYTNEQKLTAAFSLLSSTDYADAKRIVSENITSCIAALRTELQQKSSEQVNSVAIARKSLWGLTFAVIGVLLFVFVFALHQMIRPLRGFIRGIESSDLINDKKGLKEVRLLARTYNDLLDNKTKLEDFLRAAAETDALTDLPNRYYFEQYMAKTGETGPVALLLFDVNYLKDTNDRDGHLAGDMLLKRAAYCIMDCFGSLPDSKCFRYGGDEFAAIIKNCSMKAILEALSKFNEEQKKNNVSIATGYAYAQDIGDTSYHNMFLQADRAMYSQKSIIHSADKKTEETR